MEFSTANKTFHTHFPEKKRNRFRSDEKFRNFEKYHRQCHNKNGGMKGKGDENMFEIAIIGGGPAGGSAALFTSKAGKMTLVIDNGKSVTKRAWIENHYGVAEITGPDLVEIGRKQSEKFGAEWVEAEVTDVKKTDNGFEIVTEKGRYEAKQLIIATGMLTKIAETLGLKVKAGTEPRVKQIIETDGQGRTSMEGVWAAGVAAGTSVHTIITAGDGANVAINVLSEMNGERYVDHDVLKSSK